MRTLLIAGMGATLMTASAADAQHAMGRGPGASFPAPGPGGFGGMHSGVGMSAPRPATGFQPGRPGGFNSGRPGWQPGTPGGPRPGQPGTWQPGMGQPGVPGGYHPGQPGWQPGRPGGYHPGQPGWQPGRPGGYNPGRPGEHGGGRWQNRDGRWIGGWNAPGGWGGYRRPYVGWALPSYWAQPGFGIADWGAYGLAQPPYGYNWSRYYDDAVLIDGRGSVYDTVDGIDWDGGYGYDDRGYVDDRGYRRDDGLSGAAIGAVAGGALGAAVGGGVGGALIGAGVGGVAGYAIDRNEDRGRRGPPPGYGAGYPAPAYGGGYGTAPGGTWVSPNGTTTVTTSGGGYYGGGSTTTVVVQTAPVVTTTTTEIIEDKVTWSRPAHKVVKRRWRAPTKTICRC